MNAPTPKRPPRKTTLGFNCTRMEAWALRRAHVKPDRTIAEFLREQALATIEYDEIETAIAIEATCGTPEWTGDGLVDALAVLAHAKEYGRVELVDTGEKDEFGEVIARHMRRDK